MRRKKITAAFDGGRLTSDGGVMLLAAAERRLGIADKLAALIADPREPKLVRHSVADILRVRMLAIACGYADGNDVDRLRGDPGFKLACGRLPDSGADLCSHAPHAKRGTQTFIAGLRADRLAAPWIIDGPINRAAFNTYVETQLAPTLARGDVVIADNLSVHNSAVAKAELRKRGA